MQFRSRHSRSNVCVASDTDEIGLACCTETQSISDICKEDWSQLGETCQARVKGHWVVIYRAKSLAVVEFVGGITRLLLHRPCAAHASRNALNGTHV